MAHHDDVGLASNSSQAAALGLEASVDMDNMCSFNPDGTFTYENIEAAVAEGLVSEVRVNESCSRVLAQKFAAGLFEDPMTHSTNESLAALLDSAAHRRVALEASEQGITLLMNNDGYLPLKATSASSAAAAFKHGIALIGEVSDDPSPSPSPPPPSTSLFWLG